MHKFLVNSDGTLTAITQADGGSWNVGSTTRPHGVVPDLNGYLYIGNGLVGDEIVGGIDKYTCDGTLIQEDAIPPTLGDGLTGTAGAQNNIYSIDNVIYANGWYHTGYNDAVVSAYDICSGDLLGTYTVCNDDTELDRIWDFSVDKATNSIIMNTYSPTNGLAIGDLDANLNGACLEIVPGTNNGHAVGITRDSDGNIYARHWNGNLTKYDPSFNLIYNVSINVLTHDGWDILYSEKNGYLYLSGNNGDCVSIYNASDGSYVGTAYPAAPDDGENKAMSIVTECCPTPNRQTINQTYCLSGTNEALFLNDLFPCDGVVCEGQWIPVDAAAAVYNDCDQSISAGIAPGCYSFTKGSAGLENYPKCGAFELNFNLEILAAPDMTMSADQTVCSGDVLAELSATTTAANIQWQMSTTSCTDGFTNINGATAATYAPTALTETTYYRIIATEEANCSSGNCTFESDCITISVETAPTLTIDGATCDASNTTYTIDFTSDGTVTSTAGTVAGNQVIDISADTDATITATLNGCTTEETVVSPICEVNCPTTKCMQVTLTKTN